MQQQQQPMPGTPLALFQGDLLRRDSLDLNTPGTSPEEVYSDMVFVQDTLENDAAQVQMSQLAQTKSQSPDAAAVRAKDGASSRQKLNNQLKPVAKQLGVDDSKGAFKEG